MTAKTELTRQLLATFAAGTPTAEELDAILKGYIIFKENDEQRSDLKRRIKHYLGAKKIDGLSARTLANYRSHLELFASKVTKSTAKITTDDIRGYIAFLDETRNLKETSLQTHINSLRAFFGWLTMEEKIKKNPMSKIKSIKIDKVGARQALTVEELERLRDACVTYREKALIEFLVSSGCRLSEVAQLNASDLDPIGRTVRVTGKGDKDRQVYFSVRARLMVQEYMVSHLSDPLTIDQLSARFRISPTALKDIFRQTYGRPIHQYLLEKRVQHAAELLHRSPLSIVDIAAAVGYNSASQFGVAFKRRYQLTPSQYRRQSRKS